MLARLRSLRERHGAKVLLARGSRRADGRCRLWIARTLPDDETLWEWALDGPEDLLDLPLEALVGGLETGPTVSESLALVCTHGQRDRCCAALGAPVFSALEGATGGTVMRCSHLGGHRFAATAAVLPQGIVYGRLEPDHVPDLAISIATRQVFSIAHLRGRACWTRPVQAALHQWRHDSGSMSYDGMQVLGHIALGADLWRVALSTTGAGPAYCEYEVTRTPSPNPVFKSCSDDAARFAQIFVATKVS